MGAGSWQHARTYRKLEPVHSECVRHLGRCLEILWLLAMTLLILKFTALGYNFQAIVSAPTPFLLFLVRLKRWRVDQGENAGQIGAAQQVRNTYLP